MNRRNSARTVGAAFSLTASLILSSAPTEGHDFGGTSIASIPNSFTVSSNYELPMKGPETIIRYVLKEFETEGYVPNDNGHGPTKWGVNSEANELTPEQVKNLSMEDAYKILKTRYWDALDVGSLPPNLQLVVFDTAIVHGTDPAQKMLRDSKGDPLAILQMRMNSYNSLIENDPKRYGGSKKSWVNRVATLAFLQDSYGSPENAAIVAHQLSLVRHDFTLAKPNLNGEPKEVTLSSSANTASASAPSFLAPLTFKTNALLAQIPLLPELETLGSKVAMTGSETYATHPWLLGALFPGVFMGSSLLRRRSKSADRTTKKSEPKRRASNSIKDTNSPQIETKDANLTRKSTPPTLPLSDAATKSQVSSPRYDGLSDPEVEALNRVFSARDPKQLECGKRWEIEYACHSRVVVQQGSVTMQGHGGIYDAVKYAALAWQDGVTLNGGSDKQREVIRNVVQELVNDGTIRNGFNVDGLGVFHKETKAKRPFLAPLDFTTPILQS